MQKYTLSGYVELDRILSQQHIVSDHIRCPFSTCQSARPYHETAGQLLDATQRRLVQLHLAEKYCPNAVVFVLDGIPKRITAAEIALRQHPHLPL